MQLDQKTIETLAAQGVSFIGDYRAIAGSSTVQIQPQDLQLYIDDRDAFAAKDLGVTVEEYRRWVEANGMPYCGAVTASGHRCKNVVSGGGQRGIRTYLALDGGFCAVHGGEGSEEAREDRHSYRRKREARGGQSSSGEEGED